MSQKVAGGGALGCGCLLAVIGIIAMAVSWHSAAKNLLSWTVAGKKEFTFKCTDADRTADTILLYTDDDGKCEEHYTTTKVTFSSPTATDPEEVLLIPNCTKVAESPEDGANATDGAVEFMARRLGVDLGDSKRGGYELMAMFAFYSKPGSNNATECVLGTYTVKSDQPLWAISLADKLKDAVAGFMKILASLGLFIALCCVGMCCAAVGACLLCSS